MTNPTVSPAARLRWACRRGMLELDLILPAFFDGQFADLTAEEQQTFEDLLGSADQDLYAWLLGFQSCPESRYHGLLSKIQAYVKHHHSA